jgi:hypothetical protein
MRKFRLFILLVLTVFSFDAAAQNDSSYDILRKNFENPPADARPKVYWWWLNGKTDPARIHTEIKAMKDAGISGFDIFEIGVPASDTVIKPGPAFLSDESLEAIKYAVDLAQEAGMQAGLNMASSWNAGGSWIRSEHAAKSIFYSRTAISDGMPKNIKLPFPAIPVTSGTSKGRITRDTSSEKPEWYSEVAVIAVPAGDASQKPDTTGILDISEYFNSEKEFLQWVPPSGEWDVYRFVCSNSGEQLKLPSKYSAGPVIDHFDSTATEVHFQYVIDRLKTVLGDFSKTALKSLYLASYEVTGNVWTTSLPAEFRKLNGYDLYKYLPSLADTNLYGHESLRNFQDDFKKTLSGMMIRNFYGKAKEIANIYGLKINSEAGGPGLPLHNVPVEPLASLGSLDLPRGEFWINHTRFNEKGIDILRVVKEVAAASHIYGLGVVEDESFTSFQHWQEGPSDMKPYGDRAFCEGLNKVVIHGFSHNPGGYGCPGIVYHAGTHFNDKRVWWPKIKPFNDYLARISGLFQGSEFVADVLYFYGDDVPNYTGPKNGRFTAGPGYDYEVINTEILKKLTVSEGKLMLPGGARFSLMAYEKRDKTDPDVEEKINEFVRNGAIIQDATAVKALVSLGIPPDFDYFDKELYTYDYIHYVRGDVDLYFIRNTTDQWISRNCSFRQQNKIPEYWNPVSGNISPVMIYEQAEKQIIIPVTLAPFESGIIVFRKAPEPIHFTGLTSEGKNPPFVTFSGEGIFFLKDGIFEVTDKKGSFKIINNIKVQQLSGSWEIFFPEKLGAPGKAIYPELISWTRSEDPGIRYFSGIAVYKKTFQYYPDTNSDPDFKVFLDLGALSKVGEVWLNDQPLGITWCLPYRFEVTDILKPGDNNLRIEIANTWSNRLKGDAVRGENYTSTNIKTTNIAGLNNIQVPWSQVPLIESGLLGPVTLVSIKPVRTR